MKKYIIILNYILLSGVGYSQNNQTFQLDALNRQIQTSYGNGTIVLYCYDELGNRTCKTLQVTIPPTIDLTFTDTPVIMPTTVGAGSNTTLNGTLNNTGTGAAGASVVNYYLSTNNTLGGGDTLLTSTYVSSVVAGSGFSLSNIALPIPANTTSGTYYIIVVADADATVVESNENNNIAVIQITVVNCTGLSVLFNVTNTTCGNGNGAATATATGGQQPYTYLWGNGSSSASLGALAAGSYPLTATDANGCTVSNSATVNSSQGISASVATTPTSCLSNTGTATVTASGASTYSYHWNNNATTAGISNLGIGTYTVTITANNGCTTSANGTVTYTNSGGNPIPLYIGNDTSVCLGSSVILIASGGFSSYLWSNGQTTQSITLNNLSPGQNLISLLADACGSVSKDTVMVTGISLTGISILPPSPVLCSGSSITLTASGGTSYSWSSGLGTGASKSVSPIVTTTYTVTATGSNGCTAAASTSVAVSTVPATPVITSTGSLNTCSGTGIVTLSTSATGVTYLWKLNGAAISGATTSTYNAALSGTYTLVVSNSCGNATSNAIIVAPANIIYVTNTLNTGAGSLRDAITCANSNADTTTIYFNIAGTPPFVINPLSVLPPLTEIATIDATTQPGYYNGIIKLSGDSLGLPNFPNAFAKVGIEIQEVSCKVFGLWIDNFGVGIGTKNYWVEYAEIGEPGKPNYLTGSWAGVFLGMVAVNGNYHTVQSNVFGETPAGSALGNENAIVVQTTNASLQNNLIKNNNYGVKITGSTGNVLRNNSFYCNTYSAPIYLVNPGSNNQKPAPAIASATLTFITGTSQANDSVEVFKVDNTTCSTNNICQGSVFLGKTKADAGGNWTLTSPFASPLYNYNRITATATDSANNTSRFSSCLTLNVCGVVQVTITASATQICSGNTALLSASAGFASYNWSNAVQTSSTYATSTGNYSVTVTDATGCTASASQGIVVNPTPTASVSPAAISICQGSSVTLTASGGGTYAWGNSLGSNASITVSPVSDIVYMVTVTGTGNCTATATATIDVIPAVTPGITIQGNATVVCEFDTVVLTATAVNGGIGPVYQWQKNGSIVGVNSATVSIVNPLGTDVFRCILTSNATCAIPVNDTSNSISITVTPSVVSTISITTDNPNNCNNQLSNFTAVVTNGGANPVFVWRKNGLIAGSNNTYNNVFLTGGESIVCELTSSLCASPNPVISNTITVPAMTSPAAIGQPQGPGSACIGDTFTYTAAPGGSTSILWSVNNGIIVSGQGTDSVDILWQQAGNNAVIVVGSNICGSAIVNQVRLVSVPNAFTTLSAAICQGGIYPFHGADLSNTGQYFDTLSGSTGCDSIIILNLSVSSMLTSSFNASICEGDFYSFNNQNITTGGTYIDTLTSAGGCDSLVTLNLLVNDVTGHSFNASICQGDFYSFNGQNITSAGVYSDTLTNSAGCDSVLILNVAVIALPVQPVITANGDTAFCQGDSVVLQTTNQLDSLLWSNNANTPSITVFTSGTYYVQAANQCGNAVSDNIGVTVWSLPQQPAVIQNGDTLSSSVIASSYQWYLNSQPITAAINREHIIQQSGSYYVEITDTHGCRNASNLYTALLTALSETHSAKFYYSIFPNPGTGIFTLSMFSEKNSPIEIGCFNVIGQKIYSKEFILSKGAANIELDLLNESNGIYFVQIRVHGKSYFKKVTIAR